MADKRSGKVGATAVAGGDKEEKKMEESKEKSVDDIYHYDEEGIAAQRKSKPWENESADRPSSSIAAARCSTSL